MTPVRTADAAKSRKRHHRVLAALTTLVIAAGTPALSPAVADEELPSFPSLEGHGYKSYQVDTGNGTFTASQPNQSIATYVIENGQPTSVTLTAAADVGQGFHWAMDTFAPSPAQGPVDHYLTIDPTQTFQTMDGFGAAIPSSAAQVIDNSPYRDEILQELYGTGPGQAGFTVVRQTMGSSDLQASDDDAYPYTYEDTKGEFSLTPTQGSARQLEIIKDAKAIVGDDFKLIGVPWSAPGWAKKGRQLVNNSCEPGNDTNQFDRTMATEYAKYFNRYVTEMTAIGLRPWMISMQNEPHNCKQVMPTTIFDNQDIIDLTHAMRSHLPEDVLIMGWDHNWDLPADVQHVVDNSPLDYVGYHCYVTTDYQLQTTSRPTMMTECSGWTFPGARDDISGNLGWEVSNTIMGPIRHGSTGSVYWSAAQHPDGTPYQQNTPGEACDACRGVITVNEDGTYVKEQDFYFWAQFSAFVRPGAVRVASNIDREVATAAFVDGDKTILVVLNSWSAVKPGQSGGDYTEPVTAEPGLASYDLHALGTTREVHVDDSVTGYGVQVRNADGTLAPNTDVDFFVQGATFPSGATTTTVKTNAGGVAIVPTFTANQLGQVTLTATVDADAVVLAPINVNKPSAELKADVTVTPELVAGRYVLNISVTNTSSSAVTIKIATRYGAKTITSVEPGASTDHVVKTFVSKLPAGQVTVTISNAETSSTVVKEYSAQ